MTPAASAAAAAALLLAGAALSAQAQAACASLQSAVAAGDEHSRWREFAPAPSAGSTAASPAGAQAGGRRLVLEQGTLASLLLQWQHQRSGAGPASALWRAGGVVGAAAQPAIRQASTGLQLLLPF